jgi:hypothetical protein
MVLSSEMSGKSSEFQTLRTNMASIVREDTFEGQEYWVVPTVLMCEGVHNRILYTAEELSHFAETWNHKPIIVFHTKSPNGTPVSACTPELLESCGIGLIFNTVWDSAAKKLRCESWLNKAKLPQVSPEVLQCLQDGQMVEDSIGVFTDCKMGEGEWNGEKYIAVATGLKPDHLAILPGMKGACSIADGGGLLQVNQGEGVVVSDSKSKVLSFLQSINPFRTNVAEQSLREKQDAMRLALNARFTGDVHAYMVDMFDDYVICELDSKTGSKLVKLSYKADAKGLVTLGADQQEVRLQTNYIPVTNESLPGAGAPGDGKTTLPAASTPVAASGKEPPMARKEQVDALITAGAATEQERDGLNALSDSAFEAVQFQRTASKPATVTTNQAPPPPAQPAPPAPLKFNKAEEVLAHEGLNPDLKLVISEGLETRKNVRDQIIAGIKANGKNTFTDEQLGAMTTPALVQLAKLGDVEVDYSAAAPAAAPSPAAPVVNAAGTKVTPMPQMKW